MSFKGMLVEAESRLGEKPDIEKLATGEYIVMYMNFNSEPPPRGATPEDALEKFLDWHKPNKGVEDEA